MSGKAAVSALLLFLLPSAVASAQRPTGTSAPQAIAQPATARTVQVSPSGGNDLTPPTEEVLGAGIFPNAEFITSYDAGQGQRYYLFGTNASFAEVVSYYKTLLKDKGELVFDEPPVHEFDIGRFKEETMAFPPSVTVKDYAWGPFKGYLNPKPGAQPDRYRTVIQFVPAPGAAPVRKD